MFSFTWTLSLKQESGLDEKVFAGFIVDCNTCYGVIDLIILLLATQTSLCPLQQYGRENLCTQTHLPVVVFNYFQPPVLLFNGLATSQRSHADSRYWSSYVT